MRKETRCRHIGYSYRVTARVLLYTTPFVTPVVEHWLEREIAQWVHPMKDRSDDPSHHERTLYLWATSRSLWQEREREMFYLTTHSTHFIYGYMASDIWLRTILIVRKETRCRHIGYFYRLAARVLLYAPSHRQDNTYHGLWYTSRGALAGTRNSSMGPPHEGSIRRPTAPWANALPLSYVPLPPVTRGRRGLGGRSHARHWRLWGT